MSPVLKRIIENGKHIVVFRSSSGYSLRCPNHPLTQTQTSFPKSRPGAVGKPARLYNLRLQGYRMADGCYSKRLNGNTGKVDVWRGAFRKDPGGTDWPLSTITTECLGKQGSFAGLTSSPSCLYFLSMVLYRYPHYGGKEQYTFCIVTSTARCFHPYPLCNFSILVLLLQFFCSGGPHPAYNTRPSEQSVCGGVMGTSSVKEHCCATNSFSMLSNSLSLSLHYQSVCCTILSHCHGIG